MEKIVAPDYLDSQELLRHSLHIESQMRGIMDLVLFKTRQQEIEAINQLVLDAAKKSGISVYDVCLNTYPDIEYSYPDLKSGDCTIHSTVTLRPVVLNLGQGPGYWKKKYYQLKERMQELINKEQFKEDEK